MDNIVEIEHLKVYFEVGTAKSYSVVKAVDDVTYSLAKGEAMGLVGESGCGKTTTAYSIIGLLPDNGKIVGGQIKFNGAILSKAIDRKNKRIAKSELKEQENRLRKVRWKDISIIFQSAMNAFNPVMRISDQIVEAILAHENVTKLAARERVFELFSMVGIEPRRADEFPHEFSGGMKQRAMIAMALACKPQLIIADEPTTALDVIMQDRILKELKDLRKKFNLSMMLITHDISVVAETANKIAVMYAGKIVELGDIRKIFKKPSHPYTIGLMNAFPSIVGTKQRLESIPGSPPDLVNPPTGCRFHPRCKYAKEVCKDLEPQMIMVEDNHYVACHFANDIFQQQKEGD